MSKPRPLIVISDGAHRNDHLVLRVEGETGAYTLPSRDPRAVADKIHEINRRLDRQQD